MSCLNALKTLTNVAKNVELLFNISVYMYIFFLNHLNLKKKVLLQCVASNPFSN